MDNAVAEGSQVWLVQSSENEHQGRHGGRNHTSRETGEPVSERPHQHLCDEWSQRPTSPWAFRAAGGLRGIGSKQKLLEKQSVRHYLEKNHLSPRP